MDLRKARVLSSYTCQVSAQLRVAELRVHWAGPAPELTRAASCPALAGRSGSCVGRGDGAEEQ